MKHHRSVHPVMCLLAAVPLQAAITNVRVETTHRQAVISYTAPSSAACAVSAYTNAARTELVHDTNTNIFGAGSNLDSRSGSLTAGRNRTFVVGQIPLPGWNGYATTETTFAPISVTMITRGGNIGTVDTASAHGFRVNDHITISGMSDSTFNAADALVTAVVDDNTFRYAIAGTDGSSSGGAVKRVNRYSRTLQADTDHWFTITCGPDNFDGSFRTKNIPLGSTYGELMAFDWSSAPMKALFPALPDVRNYSVIDPVTGVLARRATVAGDCTNCSANDYPISFAAGNIPFCPGQKTGGGYHCLQRTQEGIGRMYWYGSGGESRYLGTLLVPGGPEWASFYLSYIAMFDLNDPNAIYTMALNTVMGANKYGLLKVTYTGGAYGLDGEVPGNSRVQWGNTINLTPASAGKSVTDLIHDYDQRFSGSTYRSCAIASVQGNYLTGSCRSYQQNSPAWYFAIYLGDRLPLGSCTDCLRVAAAAPIHENAQTRWCGSHFGNFVNGGDTIHMIAVGLTGGGATGPWEVTLTSAGGIDSITSSLTVTGEPVCNPGNLPYDGSNYLQDAAVGDIFQFADTSEYVKITQKLSPTSWVVTRGYANSAKQAHAQGVKLKAACPCVINNPGDSGPDIFWDFASDPHGTDATNTHWVKDPYLNNVHRTERQPWDVAAGWSLRYGSFPENFKSPVTFRINPSPYFAGVWTGADGNSYQKHPGYENWRETDEWGKWFVDFLPFGTWGMSGDQSGKIGGAAYLYRNTPYYGRPRDPKRVPYWAMAGREMLLDISGPGDCAANPNGAHCLKDEAADNYKFCMAYKPNECWAGSKPGDVIFNAPNVGTVWAAVNGAQASGDLSTPGAGKVITLAPCPGIAVYANGGVLISGGTGSAEFATITGNTCSVGSAFGSITVTTTTSHSGTWTVSQGVGGSGCASGESYGGQSDLCTFHANIFGQAVSQLGLTPQRNDLYPAYSRPLIRGLFSPWRKGSGNSSANALPDGRWIHFPTTAHRGDLGEEAQFLAKVPPTPPIDLVNRTTFIPLPVKLGGMPGATKTVVDFGYDPELTWRCTQRAEACTIVSSTFTDENPYALAESDETTGGVDCSAGCTINIPAITGRVVYYRWRYRGADGIVIGASPAQVAVAP